MTMQKLRNGTTTTYYDDGSREKNDCQVRLGEGELNVLWNAGDASCEEDGYHGTELSPGFFKMTADDGAMATLHYEVDGGEERLVGTFRWKNGVKGAWEVRLEAAAA